MTRQEAKEILKARGWTYLERKRRHQRYVYAVWHRGGERGDRYICSLKALDTLTPEQLVAKLL